MHVIDQKHGFPDLDVAHLDAIGKGRLLVCNVPDDGIRAQLVLRHAEEPAKGSRM